VAIKLLLKAQTHKMDLRNWTLLIISIGLAAVSFPAQTLWFGVLGWICFAPLIYLNEQLDLQQSWRVNCFFFVSLFFSLFWLKPWIETERFLDAKADLLLLIWFVFLPAACASVVSLAKYVAQKHKWYLKPFIYAGFWVSFEYLLTLIPHAFPLSIAITQTQNPAFLQLTPFLGIYGVSFLLMTVNALLAFSIIRQRVALEITALLLICFNLLFGCYQLAQASPPSQSIKIGIVQPNVSWKKSFLAASPFFLKHSLLQLQDFSQKIVQQDHPRLIIWPELAAEGYLLQTCDRQIAACAQKLNTPLLIGTYFYDALSKQTNNAAALISETGMTIGLHKKTKLFPLMEESEMQKGRELVPLAFDRGINDLGAMLCFESLYPQVARALVKEGANVLILLANGAWFGETRWGWLHQSYLVFRALESGRWAIHCNNTGPSVMISPEGVMGKVLPPAKTAIAVAAIAPLDRLTFYQASNELFPRLVLLFSVSIGCFLPAYLKGGEKILSFAKDIGGERLW
jgi:apolipoprotein N-acyltransferase